MNATWIKYELYYPLIPCGLQSGKSVLFTSKAAMCLNCRVLRHMHVTGYSRNICSHKPILVFSQTPKNLANNSHVANWSYHSLMQCLQLNNEQINKSDTSRPSATGWQAQWLSTVTGCCHYLICCHVIRVRNKPRQQRMF